MALTMTRTRTQTTLNKLAMKVAEANGELAYIDELLSVEDASAGPSSEPALTEVERDALERRRSVVTDIKDSLYTVIQQFDPELDPLLIGTGDSWKGALKRFRNAKSLRRAYLFQLGTPIR